MFHINRRGFIKNTTLAMGGLIIANPLPAVADPLHALSFSTLGCPAWTFPAIVDFATANGYQGIEIRGIHGELDLTKCPDFIGEKMNDTKKLLASRNLRIVDLGSSAQMHHADPVKRKENMEEAKRFIDLAHALDCPNIRVFPNDLPKGTERATVIELIIEGLLELGDYARGSNVHVLLESHGDCVQTNDLLYIMRKSAHPQVGMVWDICNMWTVTKETPASVYSQLKPYILHTHIKDVKMVDGAIHYVLLGTGEAPVAEAIRLLDRDKFKGYYSFEWEKLWHPEIEAPEIALAQYPKQMHTYFNDL